MLGASVTLCLTLVRALPQGSGPDSTTVRRLADLARLWGDVKYHHPALADRADIDWDEALIAAIPSVRESRNRSQFRAAVQHMLAALDDPLTHVATVDDARSTGDAPPPPLSFRITTDSILVVTTGDYSALADAENQATLQRIVDTLAAVRAVVLDVRSDRPVDPFGRLQLTANLSRLERLVTTRTLVAPGERRRLFFGFETASPFSSGQYRSGFFTRFAAPIRPAPAARDIPVVVVLNRYAVVPDAILPLQAAGGALLVFEGDPAGAGAGPVHAVPLGEGLVAIVRDGDAVLADGTSARFAPDLVVGVGSAAADSGLALARRFRASGATHAALPSTAAPLVERSYPAMRSPSLAYRLLALFRFWNTIRYFYPYHRLLDTAWDAQLETLIPRFAQAEDSVAYVRAVVDLAARLHDSHAYVAGAAYTNALVGAGYPPIRVRLVEGRPVVTAVYDSAAVRAGVRPGDIVLRVDDEDATARLTRAAALFSASTPQSLMDKATLCFMNGPVGSPVRLTLQGAAERSRVVTLTRRAEDYTTLYHRERRGEIIRVLPGNVGYVDLDRLTWPMVDSMFEQLHGTRGIIFDMRGYPNGTVWAIAPRLAVRPAPAAVFETPVVGSGAPEEGSDRFERFEQRVVPDSTAARYAGPTVMLMDGRSQSQAEHTGLHLRAANGTRFIGSATAGADGEITTVVLPGGITVGFTGQSVRFPDGTEIQRVGLTPDIRVEPTIAGIRAGRDEVVERAMQDILERAHTVEP